MTVSKIAYLDTNGTIKIDWPLAIAKAERILATCDQTLELIEESNRRFEERAATPARRERTERKRPASCSRQGGGSD
jgi:hypothetical protein